MLKILSFILLFCGISTVRAQDTVFLNKAIKVIDSLDNTSIISPHELKSTFSGEGYANVYRKDNRISQYGTFHDFKFIFGKLYVYDKHGTVQRIAVYANGKFIGNVPLPEKSNRDNLSQNKIWSPLGNGPLKYDSLYTVYSKTIADSIVSVKGITAVNLGIGYGFMNWIYGFPIGGGAQSTVTSISPVGYAVIDYGITKKSSIGIAFGYQQISSNNLYNEAPIQNVVENISRCNIGIRYLEYWNLKKTGGNIKAIYYYGIKAGVSIWNDEITNTNVPGSEWYGYNNFTKGSPNSVNLSLQICLGTRLYVANAMALHFELGLGAPFLGEAGISLIF